MARTPSANIALVYMGSLFRIKRTNYESCTEAGTV
jgi:hypothetical protein